MKVTTINDRAHLRRAYLAFKSGARLRSTDINALFTKGGLHLSANRLRELGRDSDRGPSITAEELAVLISTWAQMQRAR